MLPRVSIILWCSSGVLSLAHRLGSSSLGLHRSDDAPVPPASVVWSMVVLSYFGWPLLALQSFDRPWDSLPSLCISRLGRESISRSRNRWARFLLVCLLPRFALGVYDNMRIIRLTIHCCGLGSIIVKHCSMAQDRDGLSLR